MGNTLPGLTTNLITKIWHLPHPSIPETAGPPTIIILRHNRRWGGKVVTVDGEEVHRSKDFMDAGEVIRFEAKGRQCELTIVDYPGLSQYTLMAEGQRIPSEAETPAKPLPFPPSCVTVPSYEVRDGVAYFRVCTVVSENRSERRWRRYADFTELDEKIRSYFHGHHLASSLPHLPPKYLKAWTDHLDPAFLEGRRVELETYIRRLVAFPHANPDLVAFLGIDRSQAPWCSSSSTGDVMSEGEGEP